MTPNLVAVLMGAILLASLVAVRGWLWWQARPSRPRVITEAEYTDWLEHKAGVRHG